MRRYTRFGLPLLLTMLGGALLISGALQDRSAGMLAGAAIALLAGLAAFALQAEVITKRTGTILGLVLLLAAGVLALRNYMASKPQANVHFRPTIELEGGPRS